MKNEITDYTVLAQIADEIVGVLHKHGVRRREVTIIMQSVNEKLDSQPVQEAKNYSDSK